MKKTSLWAWLIALLALCTAPQWALATYTGAYISVSKTVTAYYERTNQYDWSIKKTVAPAAIQLGIGDSVEVDYSLDTTRTLTGQQDRYGVRGKICVTNQGEQATEGLSVSDVIQTKIGTSAPTNYVTTPIDVSAKPSLAPYETYCYPYDIAFAPVPNATYRNQAVVSITNQINRIGTVFTAYASVSFTLPSSPTVADSDARASISDLLACPAGFTCTPSETGPWNLSDSESLYYIVTVVNNSAQCGSAYSLTNTATLTESDSNEKHSDKAAVAITTEDCEPGIVGCTYTQGYWKNHKDVWPVTSLSLGSRLYTQTELLSIFARPVKGNGLVSLAHQLIAAKLNYANGASVPAGVANSISDADLLIGALVVPPVGTGSLPTSDTDALITLLDGYNNGVAQAGPPHCD